MNPEQWYLTEDLDEFLARAGDFLHSRPALHTVPLTVTHALRRRGLHVYGPEAPLFGLLYGGDGADPIRAVLLHTPPFPVHVTPLAQDGTDALVARLADLDRPVPGISATRETAAAFAAAWQRRTGPAGTVGPRQQQRLYRLEELTHPEPGPEGRARIADSTDRELLARWYVAFHEAVGARHAQDPAEWADARLAHAGVTLWETADGTPVSMAGTTPQVAGQVRLAPVYTPAELRGRGYAGAVTAEASRAAREAGAAEVVLFTDLANPTSNGLYRRIGYRPVADFAVWEFDDRT
ncbi:GNAT family N-acetyltransferase [Streptomyces broussonetiae]|uniref:GNAT family N-acetyltransferase n=1 Tax=Streptomyces broussonetiae TaxID=2686304 RepID=A0A6I6N1R8_9ACTN|nr:GNAT family N-acetyltransferase [Streptomyces broussonetiae]QHA05344.1 GNAT family N-acetyltransferase [Streptomyces broussonetiae]